MIKSLAILSLLVAMTVPSSAQFALPEKAPAPEPKQEQALKCLKAKDAVKIFSENEYVLSAIGDLSPADKMLLAVKETDEGNVFVLSVYNTDKEIVCIVFEGKNVQSTLKETPSRPNEKEAMK